MVESEANHAKTSGVRDASIEEELARVCRERDEARQQLQELRAQKTKLKSTCGKQKQALQNLCFWLGILSPYIFLLLLLGGVGE